MQKTHLYAYVVVLFSLLTCSLAQAYIAVPPSIFQDEDNLFYLTIGGGLARAHSGTWTPSAKRTTLNAPNSDHATVGMGAAAIGYGFKNYPFRIELAYNFVGISKTHWDTLEPPLIPEKTESAAMEVYSNLGLLNLHGDLPLSTHWIPFMKIGAGFGINRAKFNHTDEFSGDSYTSDSQDKNNFVWNAGVGLRYAFSESASLAAELTYLHLGEAYTNANIPTNAGAAGDEQRFAELDKFTAIVGSLHLAYHF